jgi:hypothetical protein
VDQPNQKGAPQKRPRDREEEREPRDSARRIDHIEGEEGGDRHYAIREDRAETRERHDRLQAGQWVYGKLEEHGAAKYHFDPLESDSYYIKLSGPTWRETLWGVGLEKALAQSKSGVEVGDRVGVRIRSKDPLASGRKMNRWEIEKPEFIAARLKLAREILEDPVTARQRGKQHPEIAGAYLVIRGAELLANVRYNNDEDRARFVEKVRQTIGLTPQPFKPQPETLRTSPSAQPRDDADRHREVAPTSRTPREPFTR